MDLIVDGGGLAGCYNPPLLKEANGAIEVVPPCLILPIGHSLFESLSKSNIVASFRIGDLRIEVCLSLPFVRKTFPPRGDLKGKHVCCLRCTLLSAVVVGGGDGTLGAFFVL